MNSDPASGFSAVAKSDTTVLSGVRALYVGGTGDLAVKGADGATVTFKAVPAGMVLPIQATQVLNATTATDIVALR